MVYQIAEYRITAASKDSVEEAMRKFAARLKSEFPNHFWWTARNAKDPLSYISIIASPDAATDEAASKSQATAEFVEALYPNVEGEVKWTELETVASTSDLDSR